MKTIGKLIIPIIVIGVLAFIMIADIDFSQKLHDKITGTADVDSWNRALTLYEAMLYQPSSIGSMELNPDEIKLLLHKFQDDTEADIWIRQFCICLLGEIGSQETIETFVEALQDNSGNIRNLAAASLGKYGDYRVVEPLLEHLAEASRRNEVNSPYRLDIPEELQEKDSIEDIISALLAIDDPRAKGIFVKGLQSETDIVRVASALWLGQLEDPETASSIAETLKTEASFTLDDTRFWEFGHIEALFNVDCREVSTVQAEAIALARINDKDSLEKLREIAVSDESLVTRQGAIVAIGLAGDPYAVQPLTELLNDQYEFTMIRKTAAFALGNFYSKEARDVLLSALQDSELTVSLTSALSLSDTGYIPADFVSTLLSSLQNTNSLDEIRATAAIVLGRMREKSAIKPLIDILEDTESQILSAELQEAIIYSLGNIGDVRAIDTISNILLNGETDEIKEAAIVSLGNIEDYHAIAPLKSFLEHPGYTLDQYSLAVSSLNKIDPLQTERILMDFLFEDYDISLKQAAFLSVGESEIPVLMDLLADKEDIPLKQAIILGLADSEEPKVIEFLLRSLNDDYPEVRYAALGGLAEKASLPRVSEAFIELLKHDNDPLIRSNAALALEGIEDYRATDALRTALNDPFPRVRKAAILSLTPLADLDTMQDIKPLLSDPNLGVKQSAILSLGLTANDFPQNVDYLTPGLSDDSWRIRQTTIVGLGANIDRFPELQQPFLNIINDLSQPMVFRQNAMLSLSKLDTPDIRRLLTDNLGNGDWRMRQTAALGLSSFNDIDTMSLLKPLSQDSYWQVRQATAFSLRSFDEVQATQLISPLLKDPYWQVRQTAIDSISNFTKFPNTDLLSNLKNDNNYLVRQSTSLLDTSLSNIRQPQMLWVNSSQDLVNKMSQSIKNQVEHRIFVINTFVELPQRVQRDVGTILKAYAIIKNPKNWLNYAIPFLDAVGDAVSDKFQQQASLGLSNAITTYNNLKGPADVYQSTAGWTSLFFGLNKQLTYAKPVEPITGWGRVGFQQFDGFTSIRGQIRWQVEYYPTLSQIPFSGVTDVFGSGTRVYTMSATWTETQGLGITSSTNPGFYMDSYSNFSNTGLFGPLDNYLNNIPIAPSYPSIPTQQTSPGFNFDYFKFNQSFDQFRYNQYNQSFNQYKYNQSFNQFRSNNMWWP